MDVLIYVFPPFFGRIPGGSFITGSATNTGLDGSNLAVATNSIVAVIQYRLGVVRDYLNKFREPVSRTKQNKLARLIIS